MAGFETLPPAELERFFQRTKASSALPEELDMPRLFRQILEKAAELVPSESGAILLDDPLERARAEGAPALYFVALFGPASSKLIGKSIPSDEGVAGHVYRTGTAHLSVETERDATFAPEVDRSTGYRTRSIIAAPILIGSAVCGTIELLNREGGGPYDAHDLLLLEVFASYTASSLQNALDARHAHELAKIDDLSGLFNDRYLHVRLREELNRARKAGEPCSLIFLDLDSFKPVNDTYGHLVGSQVLREVGYLLRRVTADQDAVLARYGGDEFAIVLRGRDEADAAEVAERIREAIDTATFLERSHGPDLPALCLEGPISASIGVAEAPAAAGPESDRGQWLMRRADTAMYEAKRAGKNRVVRAGPTPA